MKTASAARRARRQRGSTLLITLIMLVVLTLFAITAIRTGNIGLKIVGNQQSQKLMEAAAAQAVEQVVSNLANFDSLTVIAPGATVAQRICVNAPAGSPPVAIPPATCAAVAPGSIQVDVAPVRCISAKRQTGGSLTQPMATYENTWEIVATVTDLLYGSGAKAVYHQGVMIRMLASSCPGVTS
jgi:Tfp pilus assembly protein PilX